MNAIESKVVVIGPPNVGKTCLAIRYVRDRFVENSAATIGASFLMKTVTSGNTPITMKIWDTAGQEVFRSMSSLYYKNVDGAILVCDATDLSTIDNLKLWLKELRDHNAGSEFTVLIACNKMDLANLTDNEKLRIDSFGRDREVNAKIFYTSAKSGMNVRELFKEMADSILLRKQGSGQPYQTGISDAHNPQTEVEEQQKKKCCC